MHPIKPKQLLQHTAETTGFSLPIVTSIVKSFYGDLSQAMSSCRDIHIFATGLGTFNMNRKRTHKQLEKLQRQEKYAARKVSEKPDSKGRQLMHQDILLRILELEKASELFEDEEKKLLEFKQRRNQYEINKVLS